MAPVVEVSGTLDGVGADELFALDPTLGALGWLPALTMDREGRPVCWSLGATGSGTGDAGLIGHQHLEAAPRPEVPLWTKGTPARGSVPGTGSIAADHGGVPSGDGRTRGCDLHPAAPTVPA